MLLSLDCSAGLRKKILALKRTELCEGQLGGINIVVSRTGYTGETMGFELFIHPEHSIQLWNALLAAGSPSGLKACGLGARDSLRTEAGLPLYGHEMGGELNLGVAEAGFGSYVKTHKPWFIGRQAYLEREASLTGIVARFRFTEKTSAWLIPTIRFWIAKDGRSVRLPVVQSTVRVSNRAGIC